LAAVALEADAPVADAEAVFVGALKALDVAGQFGALAELRDRREDPLPGRRIDAPDVFAGAVVEDDRASAVPSLCVELGEDVFERNGLDAALAIGARLGDGLALLVGLGLVVERRVVEHPRDGITGRIGERAQRGARLLVGHRLDGVVQSLLDGHGVKVARSTARVIPCNG